MAISQAQATVLALAKTATFATTPTSGNLLVCVGFVRVAGTLVAPAGWSTAIDHDGDATNPGIAVWYKVAGAGESTTVTYTSSVSATVAIWIAEYSGCHATTPFDVSISATGSTATPASGVLDTAGTDKLLLTPVNVRSTTTFTAPTNSFVIDKQVQIGSAGSANRGGVLERIGAGDTTSGCTAAAAAWRCSQVAFHPSAAATQSVTGATLASTVLLAVATVLPGAVTLSLPTLSPTTAVTAPTVTPGAVTLSLPTLSAPTTTLTAPAITVGAVTLTLPTLSPTSALYAPTIATVAVADQAVTGATLLSASELFAPATASTITTTSLSSAATLTAPALLVEPAVTTTSLASTVILQAPVVETETAVITATLASTVVCFAPSVSAPLSAWQSRVSYVADAQPLLALTADASPMLALVTERPADVALIADVTRVLTYVAEAIPVLAFTARVEDTETMANYLVIGGARDLYLGEDKTLAFEVLKAGTPDDLTGWTIQFDIRSSVQAATSLVSKAATIEGTYSATRTENTQRAVVALTDEDLSATVFSPDRLYQHSLKRTNAGAELVLAYGRFLLERATQV